MQSKEWDTPESNFMGKEKRAHRPVSTTPWAGFRGRNLNSYIFHIPWKEVVKGSTWYSDKEIIDFPMTYRKLHIF